jgi:hypothetical protein
VVALSWKDRLARLPLAEDEVVEGLSRAIYMTHRLPSSPSWESIGEDMREWVRAQSRASLAHLRALSRPYHD